MNRKKSERKPVKAIKKKPKKKSKEKRTRQKVSQTNVPYIKTCQNQTHTTLLGRLIRASDVGSDSPNLDIVLSLLIMRFSPDVGPKVIVIPLAPMEPRDIYGLIGPYNAFPSSLSYLKNSQA